MNLKEMIERLNAISKRLGELGLKYGNKEQLTAEEDGELDKLMAEFNELGPQVERLAAADRAQQAAAATVAQYTRSTGSATAAAAAALAATGGDPEGRGQGGGSGRREGLSIGEAFATSDQVQEWLSRGGEKSRKVNYKSLWNRDGSPAQVYQAEGESGPEEQYTLIKTGDPAYLVPPQILPGIYRPRDYALTARDVLAGGRTKSDTIYFLRELLFTNSAAETAQASTFDVTALGSSGRKPESALTFEQASTPVVTIAHWIPITRQALADAAQLQTYVENRLLVGLERRFNSQVWNGAGGGTDLTGIANTSGVQALDAAYFAGDAVLNVGNVFENFDRVLRAATEIDLTGDAQMTFAAMNPRDLEKFQTITNSMGQYMGGGPFMTGSVRSMWGYPIVSDRAVTEGTVIAGDGTMAAIFDREDANILIDTINDQFVRNILTILAEMRAALAVFRPAGFAIVDLVAWA